MMSYGAFAVSRTAFTRPGISVCILQAGDASVAPAHVLRRCVTVGAAGIVTVLPSVGIESRRF